MIREGKFGVEEAVSLIVIVTVSKVFFSSPRTVAELVGSAGWYMTLISAAVAMLGFSFTYLLLKRFPGKDLTGAFEASVGRVPGFLFSVAFGFLFMYNAATILREFTEVLKVYSMPLTPPSWIVGLFTVGVAFVAFLGLESLVRFSRLIIYIFLSGFLIVLILAWQNYELHKLFPPLGYGIDKILYHGFTRSSAYGDVLVLAVISGSLQGLRYFKKAGFMSIVFSGLLVSVALLCFSLTFPYYMNLELTSHMYQLTALIDYGRFFQRLDPVFLFIWNIGSFITVTALFYGSVSIYCRIFRISDMRPLILPGVIILYAGAFIPKDISDVTMGYINRSREYSWIILYVLPLIALLSAVILRRKGEGRNA